MFLKGLPFSQVLSLCSPRETGLPSRDGLVSQGYAFPLPSQKDEMEHGWVSPFTASAHTTEGTSPAKLVSGWQDVEQRQRVLMAQPSAGRAAQASSPFGSLCTSSLLHYTRDHFICVSWPGLKVIHLPSLGCHGF